MTQPHPLEPCKPALDAYVTAVTKLFDTIRPAFQPYIDWIARDPEGFARACEEARRADEQPSCHCLCGLHKGTPDICTGHAEPGLTRTFHSPHVGTQHVPMCRPCHDAAAVSA